MVNEAFINYLLQFESLNKQQIDLINSCLTTKEYKEEDYFLEAGKVSNEIGFIVQGVFRVCYYNNDGDEITRYFLDEGNFIVDLNSFNSQIPSTEYIQSVTSSTVITLSKKAMEYLSGTIIAWDRIISKVTTKALSEKVARLSLMMPQDASERYSFFIENFPRLVNRVPLQYIASYIGVTKSSLSRIRKANTIKKR